MMLFRKMFTSTSMGVMVPATNRAAVASLSPMVNQFITKPRLSMGL